MGEFEVGVRAVILYDRKILLLQRPDFAWESPGGTVEFGEDLHTALQREIKEETNLDNICIDKLLYAVTIKLSPERQAVGLMYLTRALDDKVKISDEHIDFMWADKSQLINLSCMTEELKENSVLDILEID